MRAFASPGSSKSQKLPQTGLLFPKVKARKGHFTLVTEKLIYRSFPSFYGRTVLSFFPIPSPPRGARRSPPPAMPRTLTDCRPPTPPSAGAPPRHHLRHGCCSGPVGASSPERRWQGRAPWPRLGAGGGELPEWRRQGRAPWPQLRAGGGELPWAARPGLGAGESFLPPNGSNF